MAAASPIAAKAVVDGGRRPNLVILYADDKGYATACIGKWHLGWDWNAIRHRDWLLVDGTTCVMEPKRRSPPAAWMAKHGYPPEDGELAELYDLARDAGQRRNLAAEHPQQVAELRERLARMRSEPGSAPLKHAPAAGRR